MIEINSSHYNLSQTFKFQKTHFVSNSMPAYPLDKTTSVKAVYPLGTQDLSEKTPGFSL